jgi:hypothetical protein
MLFCACGHAQDSAMGRAAPTFAPSTLYPGVGDPGAAIPSNAIVFQPAQQVVYQPGQQFQLCDAPRPAPGSAPVPYVAGDAAGLAPCAIAPDYVDYSNEPWHWQLMPPGLIWHSYLASPIEPRLSAIFLDDVGADTKFDGTVGGRVSLLRYGNSADYRPEGWELDVEGAAFIRQDLTQNSDVDGYDFRVGIPITYGWGPYQMKISWFHTSSHLGDEFMLKHPTFVRLNYSRNAVVWGHSLFLTEDIRVYGEVEYAYWVDGGAEPWHFQFGFEYSPVVRGWRGAPFFAVNGQLRQENDFGGPFTLETGWQWRPPHGGQRIRLGFHYQTGPSNFYQFFRDSEEQIGFGLWYDY